MDQAHERSEFKKRVGQLSHDEVAELGLIPDTLLGGFWPQHSRALKAFCKLHPNYHIISFFLGMCCNRFVDGAIFYSLGDGDSKPDLELKQGPLTIEGFEEIKESVSAIPDIERDALDRFALTWANAVLGGANPFCAKTLRAFAFTPPGASAQSCQIKRG